MRVRAFRFLLAFTVAMSLAAGTAFAQDTPPRAKVGVALGGGSARGLAHVGVLRWLEEHHIPIDVITGTSMGGLIGGSYATGMSPDEIDAMLSSIDWDAMFGASRFEFLNVRRKNDLRSYPSKLEFGLRGGIVPPSSLNSGQQVDLLLARITGSYYAIRNFDELPTPFRCVAVDLRRAEPVILQDGSLARSMRATMSLPLVFPPVNMGERVLVDGGAMNNIPADIARGMGAAKVIAVNVGDLNARNNINTSMLGLVGETLDAMMRANTLRATTAADVMINVPLSDYGSLDWRRAKDLIREGYAAAESMRDKLLPLAVDETAFRQWQDARAAARKTTMPVPAFVNVTGAGSSDHERMTLRMARHVGVPFDYDAIAASITELSGLDRYETLSWELVPRAGTNEYGLEITARPKTYGPPFMYLGIALENTTSNEFRFGIGGRYLAFDVLGSGTESRIDANVGSDPSLAASWYRPLFSRSFFFQPAAGVQSTSFYVIKDGHTAATYRSTRLGVGGDIGVNFGSRNEMRVGMRYGWTSNAVRVGDPGLPELEGEDSIAVLKYTHDTQDSVVVPSRGLRMETNMRYFVAAPEVTGAGTTRTNEDVIQLDGGASWFKSLTTDGKRRLLVSGGGGTSFDTKPLATEQYALGGPMRMSAFSVGQVRGDHFVLGTVGYLHQLMRLPDFLGGPVFIGSWMDLGAAFNAPRDANVDTHASVGAIADTLLGPIFAGASWGFDNGDSRYYIGIGRIFR